jgi:hypothetical protein
MSAELVAGGVGGSTVGRWAAPSGAEDLSDPHEDLGEHDAFAVGGVDRRAEHPAGEVVGCGDREVAASALGDPRPVDVGPDAFAEAGGNFIDAANIHADGNSQRQLGASGVDRTTDSAGSHLGGG